VRVADATCYASSVEGGARSGTGADDNLGGNSAESAAGANGVDGTLSKAFSATGSATATAAATVTFLGGQSMFLAKLGVRDAVSSF